MKAVPDEEVPSEVVPRCGFFLVMETALSQTLVLISANKIWKIKKRTNN